MNHLTNIQSSTWYRHQKQKQLGQKQGNSSQGDDQKRFWGQFEDFQTQSIAQLAANATISLARNERN